jgi:hypothetical protein
MALGDIQIYDEGAYGYPGDAFFTVASGTTSSILPGTPVAKTLGNSTGNVVAAAGNNFPVVGTDYTAGIASSTSTETTSLAGTVKVTKLDPNLTYIIAPKVAATWDTQAEYDALVGARVLIDLTTGVYTILASDSANNGCVVEPLDISKYPGRVRFSIRAGASYKA